MNRDLTEDELRRLFKCLKNHRADPLARRDLAVYQFLNETGLRINEFAQTTKGDARQWIQNARLFIAASRRKGVRTQAGRIERRDHSYLLNQTASNALRELLTLNEQQMRSQGDLWDDDCPLVVAKTGAALSVRSYQARLQGWANQAGLPAGISPHCFRHTVAQRTRRQTVASDPFLQVAYKLGQSARASAMLYSKPSRQELEAEAERLEGHRGGRTPKREFLRGMHA
ncbi:site-specific integrase [Deefgea piscis]|uniref:site-specific integrase n=1 Tax=Deefgea piscis TaxID=2739061 RepID=UPI001C809C36|nr:site-specific integrase [Deefgea piscis]QZA80875.1 site-specific integrase [Deefgea piscis]